MKIRFLLICIFAVSATLSVAVATAQQFDNQAEPQLVDMLNLERARAGLPSLKTDDRLTQAAREHSVLMAKAKQLSHEFPGEPPLPKRLAAANLRFDRDAENVAYDYSVEAAHEGLMLSAPHRANILSPNYNTVGIGVVRSGDLLWVTEDFAHRVQEYSVNEAENAIIAAFEQERRRAHIPLAQVVRMPQLPRMACAMAQQGRLDSRTPLGLPEVDAAVAYTESEPSQLPPNAVKMAHDLSVKRFAVGACFADSAQYPTGVWWVVIVFF
ncbi:MAG: CAP domain-containing protein [Acidobacteriia bacterium]|nr:CAP domain-containing protein [Terriglobia bacterium]